MHRNIGSAVQSGELLLRMEWSDRLVLVPALRAEHSRGYVYGRLCLSVDWWGMHEPELRRLHDGQLVQRKPKVHLHIPASVRRQGMQNGPVLRTHNAK